MRRLRGALLSSVLLAPFASAQIHISEVFINPFAGFDSLEEYIELRGAPNMKLDGYALCYISGCQIKYWPLGSVTNDLQTLVGPNGEEPAEIDEFFALDGLTLGPNGFLVIGTGTSFDHVLPADTNYFDWHFLWNGFLDTVGMLQNDGSGTLLLVRNRPGTTPADPFNAGGLRWGKDIDLDAELITPVVDPDDGMMKDQLGDGSLDDGGAVSNQGLPTLDLVGLQTPTTLDDLEIVDEVSFEHDQGWEYDVDPRLVDVGGTTLPGKERRVHALDDPSGFNPDALTRVDYRRNGPGWTPAPGATGEMANGNNWQDTATEQWIRGETTLGTQGFGNAPFFYYLTDALTDANDIAEAPQPYTTHVPSWLADGQGADFQFVAESYQLLPGIPNPLQVPFIVGDFDRDGDADDDDAKLMGQVFGDADFLYPNGLPGGPQNGLDPAVEVRPWDLDIDNQNGFDPNDLQWCLTSQGDTTGLIQGLDYDATGPSPVGVFLGQTQGVVTITANATSDCAPLNALRINDAVDVVFSCQVTGAPNTTAGQENGVQQFFHDLFTGSTGVVKVESVEALGAFQTTRASLQTKLGTDGDTGMSGIHGYATDFTQGLSTASEMVKVRLRCIGAGTASISLTGSAQGIFATTAPSGMKLAHTAQNGDAAAVIFPAGIALTVTSATAGGMFEFGAPCLGSGDLAPALHGSGCPTPGGAVTLDVENGLGGAVANMFIGLGTTSAPLVPTCSLHILPILPQPIVFPLTGVGPGNGAFTLPLVIPANVPGGLGINAYLQVLYADAGAQDGIAGTNALQMLIH